jgi:hypothetical protein
MAVIVFAWHKVVDPLAGVDEGVLELVLDLALDELGGHGLGCSCVSLLLLGLVCLIRLALLGGSLWRHDLELLDVRSVLVVALGLGLGLDLRILAVLDRLLLGTGTLALGSRCSFAIGSVSFGLLGSCLARRLRSRRVRFAVRRAFASFERLLHAGVALGGCAGCSAALLSDVIPIQSLCDRQSLYATVSL